MVQMILTYDEQIRSIRERDAEGSFEFTEFDPGGVYDADGNPEGSPQFNPGTASSLRDSEFDVDVTTGSRYAQGRVANEERALELFQVGVYGIEEVVNALNITDKQQVIQNWYVRNQQMPPQQQVEQAEGMQERFGSLVAQAMQEGIGGQAEEAIAQMVMQNPGLLESPDFQALPPEMQERIMTVTNMVGGQGEMEQMPESRA